MSETEDQDQRQAWCEWCGRQFRRPAQGRPRLYCRRSCRQRAYEHRQEQERTQTAVWAAERALLGPGDPVPSRDETSVEPLPSPRRPSRRRVVAEALPLWSPEPEGEGEGP